MRCDSYERFYFLSPLSNQTDNFLIALPAGCTYTSWADKLISNVTASSCGVESGCWLLGDCELISDWMLSIAEGETKPLLPSFCWHWIVFLKSCTHKHKCHVLCTFIYLFIIYIYICAHTHTHTHTHTTHTIMKQLWLLNIFCENHGYFPRIFVCCWIESSKE